MKRIDKNLTLFEEKSYITSNIFNVSSTVIDYMQMQLSGNDVIFYLYIDKESQEIGDFREIESKNQNLIDLFGRSSVYKFCFAMIERFTKYEKQKIKKKLETIDNIGKHDKYDMPYRNKEYESGEYVSIKISIPKSKMLYEL